LSLLGTIVAGFLVFVAGQAFLKIVIEPVADFRRYLGTVAHVLIELAAVLSNPPAPPETAAEAKEKLRGLSAELQARAHVIPKYAWVQRMIPGLLPSPEKINQASALLIGISNAVYDRESCAGTRSAWEQQVKDLLGIYVSPSERVSEDTVKRLKLA
jgi:hypothetical protein